jgi:hypothetical protein
LNFEKEIIMLKKVTIVIGTFLAVGVLALFSVGSVFAQTPTPTSPSTPQTPLGNAWGRVCNGAGVVSDAITNLLGMSQEEIYAERSSGKTLSEIAKEKGITDQQVIDAMLAGREEVVKQAVQDGRITQAQADWMLEKMKAVAPFMLNNPFGPGGMHGMRAGGRGRWAGGAAPWATATQPAP